MRRLLIAGGTALLPSGRLEPRDVLLEGERIAAVAAPGSLATAGRERLDARGHVVAPGFIDTHVHGGAGASFMAADPAALATIGRHLAAGGVTACLATTVTTDRERLLAAVERLAAVCADPAVGPEVVGIHLEGPFLNPDFRGVHAGEHVRPPSVSELRELCAAAGAALRVVTLAPELPGGLDAVALLREHGAVASLGHSGATYAQARGAIDAGITRVTHLFNALPRLHHRAPGAVLAALRAPHVLLELVCDGAHVDPALLAFVVESCGAARVVAVTDGSDAAGLPDGPQRRWEGTAVELDGGRPLLPGGALAGGGARMRDLVATLVHHAGVPLANALEVAGRTPAESIGLGGRKGVLQPGADADVVVLGPDLEVAATIARGRTIHQRLQEAA